MFIILSLFLRVCVGMRFGVFADFLHTAGLNQTKLIQPAEELGIQSFRMLFPWERIEINEGQFNYLASDFYLTPNFDRNITPIVTIQCRSSWGSKNFGSGQSSSPPKNYTIWKRFIESIIDKYGDRVKYWQIENEIFAETYWNGTLEEYVYHMNFTYDVIKEKQKDSKVVLAGLPNIFDSYVEYEKLFYGYLYENFTYLMRNSKYDVIDMHYYSNFDVIYRYLGFIQEENHDKKEVICTESGDLDFRLFRKHILEPNCSYSEIYELFAIQAFYDEFWALSSGGFSENDIKQLQYFMKNNEDTKKILFQFQAEGVVKRSVMAFSQGVTNFMWLCMQDFPKAKAIDWFFVGMCMIDEFETKKPVFYTYKILIEKFRNFESVEEISNPQEKEKIFKFVLSKGRNYDKFGFVIWNSLNYTTEISLSSIAKDSKVNITYIVTSLDENDNPIYIGDDLFVNSDSIPISKTPILIFSRERKDSKESGTGVWWIIMIVFVIVFICCVFCIVMFGICIFSFLSVLSVRKNENGKSASTLLGPLL